MVIEAINSEEELTNIKATLERLSKESEEKDARIKYQNRQIAALKKELGKRSSKVSNKDLDSEDSDKEYNHSNESNGECKSKNNSILNSMSVEQIQNLIVDAVKTHLERGSHKTHDYSKPYMKRIDTLRMPQGFQPLEFHQFDGKGKPKQHIAYFIETCNNVGTGVATS